MLLALPGDHGRGRPLAEVAPEFAERGRPAERGGEAEEEIDVVRGRDSAPPARARQPAARAGWC